MKHLVTSQYCSCRLFIASYHHFYGVTTISFTDVCPVFHEIKYMYYKKIKIHYFSGKNELQWYCHDKLFYVHVLGSYSCGSEILTNLHLQLLQHQKLLHKWVRAPVQWWSATPGKLPHKIYFSTIWYVHGVMSQIRNSANIWLNSYQPPPPPPKNKHAQRVNVHIQETNHIKLLKKINVCQSLNRCKQKQHIQTSVLFAPQNIGKVNMYQNQFHQFIFTLQFTILNGNTWVFISMLKTSKVL